MDLLDRSNTVSNSDTVFRQTVSELLITPRKSTRTFEKHVFI